LPIPQVIQLEEITLRQSWQTARIRNIFNSCQFSWYFWGLGQVQSWKKQYLPSFHQLSTLCFYLLLMNAA